MDIARRGIELFNARDVERIAEIAHPDLVWRPAMGTLEGREYHGLDGIAQYRQDLDAGFRDIGFEIEAVEPIGSDTVLVIGRLYGTGFSSGVSVSGERGVVIRFRDDKITSIESFPFVARARGGPGRSGGMTAAAEERTAPPLGLCVRVANEKPQSSHLGVAIEEPT